MSNLTLKHVNFKLKTEDLLDKIESLSFFYGKSQQEILEEALIFYWERCISMDKDLETVKKLQENRKKVQTKYRPESKNK